MKINIFDTNEKGEILTQGLGRTVLYGAIEHDDHQEIKTSMEYPIGDMKAREICVARLTEILTADIEKRNAGGTTSYKELENNFANSFYEAQTEKENLAKLEEERIKREELAKKAEEAKKLAEVNKGQSIK